jgi:hypothetical protein
MTLALIPLLKITPTLLPNTTQIVEWNIEGKRPRSLMDGTLYLLWPSYILFATYMSLEEAIRDERIFIPYYYALLLGLES